MAAYALLIIFALHFGVGSPLEKLWLALLLETDFMRLLTQEVGLAMTRGGSFEDAWKENYQKYFPQHYNHAVYELTGKRGDYPISREKAQRVLRIHFHDRVYQELVLPNIIPEI
jgi:hypothetical protein